MFTEQQLLNCLNDILQVNPLSEEDVRRPSASRTQDVFLRLLIECGCNELLLKPTETRRVLVDINNPNVEKFPEEMYTDTMPIDTLLVALRWTLRSLGIPNSETMVTLQDLIEPQAKRNREILTVFASFWLMSNQQYELAQSIIDDVKSKLSGFEDSRSKVREKRKQIEELRKELARCKENNNKDARVDEELRATMEKLQDEVQTLNLDKEKKKVVMDEKKRELQGHRDKIEGLENKIKDMKDELEGGKRLKELKETLDNLIQMGNRKNVEVQNFDSERRRIESKIKDLESLVPSLLESCRQVELKLESSERELRLLSTDAQLQNNDVLNQQDEKQALASQLEQAKSALTKKQSAWKRKREMKLTDRKALEAELNEKHALLLAQTKDAERTKNEIQNEITAVEDAMNAESREMKARYQEALRRFADEYRSLDAQMNIVKKVFEKIIG